MFCCQVPTVPVRAEFKHESEQISQLLLGESVHCLEISGNWARIQCTWDEYTGWVPLSALRENPEPQPEDHCILSDYASLTDHMSGSNLLLSMGSIVRPILFPNGFTVNIGEIGHKPVYSTETPHNLIWTIGKEWIGTPYQWGGRSRFGVDCSGFVQVVMSRIGIPVPRDSKDQLNKAPHKVPILDQNSLKNGQLAFFGPEPNRINHVGFVLPGGKILHSSGEVRVDSLSTHGIHKHLPSQPEQKPSISHILQALATYF